VERENFSLFLSRWLSMPDVIRTASHERYYDRNVSLSDVTIITHREPDCPLHNSGGDVKR
jgi:hypothetical protein